MDVNKIVLAYSGGLDTSVILTWLAEEDNVYDQADATGFIRLNGLRLRIQALREK
jgi:argininosuccinate synthase